MTDAKRLTWAELQAQAPGLCEAVLAWMKAADLTGPRALLTGQEPPPQYKSFWASDTEGLRLHAATYRMEAEAAARRLNLVLDGLERGILAPDAAHSLGAFAGAGGWRHELADALDAAADEAEAKAGG